MAMKPGDAIPVLPFFNLVMVWNRGVSYGLFQAESRLGAILLVLLAFLAVCGLGWWLWHAQRRALAVGLGLVIGGAIGNNLIDRLIYGKVADFFHFYVFGYSWYVFNVADAAITFGVIALIYGKVADFFHFYGLGYDWYVFNVADAAITFGVIALLYDALMAPAPRPGPELR